MALKQYLLLLGCCLAFCFSCQDDLGIHQEDGGPAVEWTLSFNADDDWEIVKSSRATFAKEQEQKVYNLYLMIFNGNGKKIYGHYFDSQNYDVELKNTHSWKTADNSFQKGEIKIRTLRSKDCTLYAVANLDPDMVNVSPERLDRIATRDELEHLNAAMNQQSVSRSGRFLMSAKTSGVNVGHAAVSKASLDFKRLDAKIIFNVYVDRKNGNGSEITEFIPESWEVANIPACTNLIENSGNQVDEQAYFRTLPTNFEQQTEIDVKGQKIRAEHFSFYMPENLQQPQKNPQTLADRSRRLKNSDGTNGKWKFAPEEGTYVILKGRLKINPKQTTDAIGDQESVDLISKVSYLIHLGDFRKNVADYNVKRNTQYTYNVGIRGIHDIWIEIQTSDREDVVENAPGASGQIIFSDEKIFQCDAHYESHVMTFHAERLKPESMGWYVQTPFCEGAPTIIEGVDVPTGLDYKWVHFQVNDLDEDKKEYKEFRKKYDPQKGMDIIELVKFLRECAIEWKRDPRSPFHHFDSHCDPKTGKSDPRICITAHVDEFYYEKNPITEIYEKHLWKRFVNRPPRVMHILNGVKYSKDKESMAFESAFTISQRSIQTIYNEDNAELESAWGCEFWDDFPDEWGYVNPKDPYKDVIHRNNTSDFNGRLNTCKEWNLTGDGYSDQFDVVMSDKKRWSTYLNWEMDNATPMLKDNMKSLRYSCMTRNRDNNNNGIIEEDEVRWYTASIRQLVGIWMGADGISNHARLYRKQGVKSNANDNSWRQHVISSTMYGGSNSNNPALIWAEEATSTGSLLASQQTFKDQGAPKIYSVRCVRNLGEVGGKDITRAPISVQPEDYVRVDNVNNGQIVDESKPLTFDLSRLKDESIRYFTSNELTFGDENSMQNRLYSSFQANPKKTMDLGFENVSFDVINRTLNSIIKQNPYCPTGYRLPNQRELTLMRLYLPYSYLAECGVTLSRTKYSLGAYGKKLDGVKGGWIFYHDNSNYSGNVQMSDLDEKGNSNLYKTRRIRCVRDVK